MTHTLTHPHKHANTQTHNDSHTQEEQKNHTKFRKMYKKHKTYVAKTSVRNGQDLRVAKARNVSLCIIFYVSLTMRYCVCIIVYELLCMC